MIGHETSLTDLIQHILDVHHTYLGANLPRIEALTHRVAQAEGQQRPELFELRDLIDEFVEEIHQHMVKEEQILFPVIRQMESEGRASAFECGTIRNPIQQMEIEHEEAQGVLEGMRALTRDYTASEDDSDDLRELMRQLRQLDRDMQQHIHKEDDILFPRAIETERMLQERGN